MRDALIIFIAIIISIAVGGYLFLNGGPQFSPSSVSLPSNSAPGVLAKGQHSGEITRRTNFRILSEGEFQELWRMVHGPGGPIMPSVDFSSREVIAVFDGTHSTGGYDVEITEVKDSGGMRVVHILRTSPGDSCNVTNAITSPYQIVVVPKSPLPIEKEEEVRVTQCL